MSADDIVKIISAVVGGIILLGVLRVFVGIPMPWDRVNFDD